MVPQSTNYREKWYAHCALKNYEKSAFLEKCVCLNLLREGKEHFIPIFVITLFFHLESPVVCTTRKD